MDSMRKSIYYQLFVPSFYDSDGDGIGDIHGIYEKLPYLVGLGVTDVVLNALLETSNLDSLYATTDFMRSDTRFGTIDELLYLIDSFHEAGIRVALSLPIKAVSVYHPWFINATSATIHGDYNLFKEYFIWQVGRGSSGRRAPKLTSNLPVNSKYVYQEKVKEWYLATSDGYPLLNTENPRVRREIIDILTFWREKNVDAFFLEGLHMSVRNSEQDVDIPVYKLSEDIFEVGRGNYKLLRDILEKNDGNDHKDVCLFDAEINPTTASYLLGDTRLADHIGNDVVITENRAENKGIFRISVFLEKCKKKYSISGISRYFSYFEDAYHERLLQHILNKDTIHHDVAAKSLCVLILTAPGIPCLYQGQEIGMFDKKNKKTMERNLPMQWDNHVSAGFTMSLYPWKIIHDNYSKINVFAQVHDADSVLNCFKKMILFRNEHLALTEGTFVPLVSKSKEVLAFMRETSEEKLFVVCSFSEKELNYKLPEEIVAQKAFCIFSNYNIVSASPHRTIGLRPFETRIYTTVISDRKLLN